MILRDPNEQFARLVGLRLGWRRSGEARGSGGQPLWGDGASPDEFVRSGTNAGERRCFRRRCDNSGDELTKRAVVILVDARTLRGPVRFGVWPDCGGCVASRCGCIHHADDARQKRLGEGADEYPTANSSRKSYSRWCHVT